MDETTNNQPQPATSPVMDVQAPQPTTFGTVSPTVANATETPPASNVPSMPSTQDTISPETPVGPMEPPSSPVTAAPLPQSPPNTPTPNFPNTPNPMAVPQHGVPKKKRTGMVIVVAVVVALILAVIAVYAYKKNSNTTSSVQTAAPTPTVTAVKASDVDQTSQELDKSLASTNDSKDFASSDLTDATLGL